MSKREEFLQAVRGPAQAKPQGIEWFSAVACQLCGEYVDHQTYYPDDSVLYWECTKGHRSLMENFNVL